MTKVLEILFRNKAKLLALALVPVVISGVIVFLLPRSYQVTSRLWASRRYAAIGATGTEQDLQSTPAVTQATALSALLQTENFDLAVAKDTDLAKHIGVSTSDTHTLQDALYAEISAHVQVTATSYNLLVITYSNRDPVVAMQVVKAVISQYGEQSATNASAEGQQLLAIYTAQREKAQQAVDDATHAAAQYLHNHNLTPTTAATDPQYLLLSQKADQARATLGSVQNNINTINQELAQLGGGGLGLFNVVDPPTVPTRPESRTKSLLLGGGVGFALGLLACIGYFLILVRLDHSIYSSAEMPAITDHPVLIQIPRLPRRSTTWITHPDGSLLSDKGA